MTTQCVNRMTTPWLHHYIPNSQITREHRHLGPHRHHDVLIHSPRAPRRCPRWIFGALPSHAPTILYIPLRSLVRTPNQINKVDLTHYISYPFLTNGLSLHGWRHRTAAVSRFSQGPIGCRWLLRGQDIRPLQMVINERHISTIVRVYLVYINQLKNDNVE